MIDGIVLALFAVWIALTLVCQTRNPISDFVRYWDLFALVPLWTFFSPNPLRQNVNLFYRMIDGGHECGPWRRVLPPERQGLSRLGFNPHRRARKALIDLAIQFSQEQDRYGSPQAMRLSVPYIAFLMESIEAASHSDAAAIQFCVLATEDDKPADVPEDALIVISDIHPVTP